MSRIELAPELGDDFDRIIAHLADHDAANAPLRIEEIIKAIAVLRIIKRYAAQRNLGYN